MTEEEFRHGGLAANPAPVGLPAVSDVAQRTDTPIPEPRYWRSRYFSPEGREALVNEICERLSKAEPLAQICRDEHMPSRRAVNAWMQYDEEIASAIACARDLGYDVIATRLRETARGNGDSTDDVQRDKLIIETDLKLLAKWDPKRYGDKMTHSNDAENPMPTSIVVQFHD